MKREIKTVFKNRYNFQREKYSICNKINLLGLKKRLGIWQKISVNLRTWQQKLSKLKKRGKMAEKKNKVQNTYWENIESSAI